MWAGTSNHYIATLSGSSSHDIVRHRPNVSPSGDRTDPWIARGPTFLTPTCSTKSTSSLDTWTCKASKSRYQACTSPTTPFCRPTPIPFVRSSSWDTESCPSKHIVAVSLSPNLALLAKTWLTVVKQRLSTEAAIEYQLNCSRLINTLGVRVCVSPTIACP